MRVYVYVGVLACVCERFIYGKYPVRRSKRVNELKNASPTLYRWLSRLFDYSMVATQNT